MSNTVRTFRAATADEALAQVRREMGMDAVVVEVKQVLSRGLFAWFASRQQFEVKATRAAASQRNTRATAGQACPAAPSSTGTIAAAAARSRKDLDTTSSTSIEGQVHQNRQSAAVLAELNDSKAGSDQTGHAQPPKGDRSRQPSSNLVPPSPLLPELCTPRNRIAAVLDRSDPRSIRTEGQFDKSVTSSAIAPTIEQRLDALQQLIADLGQRSQPRGLVEIPPELFPLYLALVESDVEDEIARELVHKLHRHAAPGQLTDTPATTALLTALIEQQIRCDRHLVPVSGRRQIAMVVGPTGVGKTTTLAKLAGRFGMQPGCRLGLITVDTYRVAAVEQLRTYAEIIDLPMRIVADASQMQEALDSFANCDLVLIDTAGRNPHDDRRLTELKQLIEAACPDHVYLVLSLASGANALRTAANRFSSVHPTSLVFTKLDEAAGCGGLLAAARDIGLPISYFTTGQEVPRDIEPANPCRAARLIVGTDQVNRTTVQIENGFH